MYFGTKNYLKNNHYHTNKHTFKVRWFLRLHRRLHKKEYLCDVDFYFTKLNNIGYFNNKIKNDINNK